MKTLKITHNAGFFSCCSKRLEGIVWFFNTTKSLPDQVDSSEQFSLYKASPTDDLTSLYFKESNLVIPYTDPVTFYNDMQFIDYNALDFDNLTPFIEKYFSPSDQVTATIAEYEKKYHIDYATTCALFYRGNDKATETSIAPYEYFIAQARVIKAQQPDVVFLVQTDETEFIEAFKEMFSDVIVIEEIPHMSKKSSTIHDELPVTERAVFGANFFAALLIVSKAKYLITHSGNCGLWALLYRGNSDNAYQWLNDTWHRSRVERFFIWLRIVYKKTIRTLVKGNSNYFFINDTNSLKAGSFKTNSDKI